MSRHRLRPDLVIIEQTYRGEQSYIVKDPETRKYFRFGPVEVLVMQEFDGQKSPAEIAAVLEEQGLPFSAAAVEGFARKLNQMGLLERTLAQKSVLLLERLRAERHRRLKRTHYTGSLLRMRFPVGDPDRLFDRWLPHLRFFFSRPFIVISVALFVVYAVIAAVKWPDLWRGLAVLYTPSAYTVGLIVVFWLTAMVVIAIHELGHGITCKYFGGQVHEMGAMLIYFQPAFYCNVNDAWTFPDLRARLWVTAAGSWIQLVVAALAAIVWWVAEPGTLVSYVALFAVIVGGVTTVVANANPLIPLDGYYALSDYLEIPNLRQRAFGYIGWLIRRHVLRLAVPPPDADARERRVFAVYGTLALLYSFTILFLIAGALFGWASRSLGAVGVIAFAALLWSVLRARLRDLGHAVVTSVREHAGTARVRRWAPRIAAAGAGLVLAALLIPWPITVGGVFTARPAFELALAAPEGGLVAEVHATEGVVVPAGAPIVTLRNYRLERRVLALRRVADSLAAAEAEARARGATEAVRQLAARRAMAEAEWTGGQARLRALTLRATTGGVVLTPRLEEAIGRWIAAGEVPVRLGAPDSLELRIVLERAGATLVRPGQPVALLTYAAGGVTQRARVASLAAAADGDGRRLEARVRVAGDGRAWRAGTTGEARIVARRSTALGALWWGIRKRVRTDWLL